MTAHKSQLERVRTRLEKYGYITRNMCLSQFPAITRLGARIDDLKREGWTFETEHRGGDYVYKVIAKPAAKPMALPL